MENNPLRFTQHPNYPSNFSRKASASVLSQLSYTSRQNLQHNSQQHNNNDKKYQHQYYFSSQQPENRNSSAQSQQHLNLKHNAGEDVGNLHRQNQSLRKQLEAQKQKYQLEINKLKRNILLKDQLLDQCEKQIVNLKTTYKNLITHLQDAKNRDKYQDKFIDNQVNLQEGISINNRSQKNAEANLIPLSLAKKPLSRVGSLSVLGGQKMTHGLIRGRS